MTIPLHHGSQQPFPFDERAPAKLRAVEPQQIEYVEHRLSPPAEKFVELRTPLRIETDNLGIEDGFPLQFGLNCGAQPGKAAVHVAAPGNQSHAVFIDVPSARKPSCLSSKM